MQYVTAADQMSWRRREADHRWAPTDIPSMSHRVIRPTTFGSLGQIAVAGCFSPSSHLRSYRQTKAETPGRRPGCSPQLRFWQPSGEACAGRRRRSTRLCTTNSTQPDHVTGGEHKREAGRWGIARNSNYAGIHDRQASTSTGTSQSGKRPYRSTRSQKSRMPRDYSGAEAVIRRTALMRDTWKFCLGTNSA